MKLFLLVLTIALALPLSSQAKDAAKTHRKPASEIQCPEAGQEGSLEKTVAMVKAASSCYEADAIATQCAWGSSADVQIAGAAGDLCAKAFQGKLTPDDKKIYLALINKCKHKYAHMQGTLYIGAEAFCEESVGKLFSDLYTPAE